MGQEDGAFAEALSVAVLAPIVVTGSWPGSGALAAAARPKPKPAPRRRAPARRKPPAKRPPARPVRRAPARKPSTAPRISPLKIAKTVAKRFPVGRIVELGQWWGNTAFKALQNAAGGPVVWRSASGKGELPFVKGQPRAAVDSIGAFPSLAPKVVTRSAPLQSSFASPSYFGAPASNPSPWAKPKMKPGTKKSPSSPLTRKSKPGVKSKPKAKIGEITLSDIAPQPKQETERDPCKQKRKRDRKKCPDSGYRRICKEWEKVKCQ